MICGHIFLMEYEMVQLSVVEIKGIWEILVGQPFSQVKAEF